jgi:BirA family biotin operon repressor/biotin-[acetyl-CoA-carboxylase] ligase
VAEYRYDGLTSVELASLAGAPHVELLASVSSTNDVAHELAAAGAPAGTVVLADEQTGGRGRGGRSWASRRGAGVWLTTIERPADAGGLPVLSLRVGLAAATALDVLAGETVRVKWPNDLHLVAGKVGGILVEARWREARAEWVAIGFGLNLDAPPELPYAAGFPPGTTRAQLIAAVVPAIRAAAAGSGPLLAAELAEFARRDLARGRALRDPLVGIADGLAADGALLVRTSDGVRRAQHGSLVFADG